MRRLLTNAWLLIPLVVVLGVGVACGTAADETPSAGQERPAGPGERVAVDGGSYVNVTPTELRTLLESEDVLLVNVHIPYEGEIEGTDLFIPFDRIDQQLDLLPREAEKIVLYCRSGAMSATAARTLVALGYDNVWNLDGGMIAWQDAGYPLLHRRAQGE